MVKVETDSDRALYIKKSDKNKCYRSAFNWTDLFYNLNVLEAHKDDIICDRTSVIEKLIECFNEQIKSLRITRMLLEKWWYGSQIVDEYLKGIFGSNEKYEFAKKMRDQFQKAVCRHPLEWDKTLFNCKKIEDSYFGITHTHLREHVKRKLVKESEQSDIWEGALDKLFKKNDFYFVHPLYFAHHLDRAEVFGFNPYEGYSKKYNKEDGKNVGDIKEIYNLTVKKGKQHNPGFAPLAAKDKVSDDYPLYNGQRYAKCSAPCLIKRYSNASNAVNHILRHTGVDLAPGAETDIISLIYGTIWAYTNDDVTYGNLMIIKEKNTNYLYILGHIKDKLKDVGTEISPGDSVAVTGGVGPGNIKYAVHLHLEIRECFTNNKEDILDCSGSFNLSPDKKKGTFKWKKDFGMLYPGPRRFDPFDHSVEYNNII